MRSLPNEYGVWTYNEGGVFLAFIVIKEQQSVRMTLTG